MTTEFPFTGLFLGQTQTFPQIRSAFSFSVTAPYTNNSQIQVATFQMNAEYFLEILMLHVAFLVQNSFA